MLPLVLLSVLNLHVSKLKAAGPYGFPDTEIEVMQFGFIYLEYVVFLKITDRAHFHAEKVFG